MLCCGALWRLRISSDRGVRVANCTGVAAALVKPMLLIKGHLDAETHK